jgi:oligopeptide/dipeptide ABC transporter ATP-binding protein
MALSIIGLIRQPPGRIEGEIWFRRRDSTMVDLTKLNPKGKPLREIRGGEIGMIFQDPMSSLTPVYTIGEQIVEAIQAHESITHAAARARAIEMLTLVGIPTPERRIDQYPHELSGGMNQRAMIAMALACHPSLLIADEPTTALDVTIQAQILDLMRQLQKQLGMSIVMITHDLGVVAQMADHVAVMYLGEVVEYAATVDLFARPLHPYTQGLLKARPVIGEEATRKFNFIPGIVPDPRAMPSGCRFSDRCPHRMPICSEAPPVFDVGPGHIARCWLRDQAHIKQADESHAEHLG